MLSLLQSSSLSSPPNEFIKRHNQVRGKGLCERPRIHKQGHVAPGTCLGRGGGVPGRGACRLHLRSGPCGHITSLHQFLKQNEKHEIEKVRRRVQRPERTFASPTRPRDLGQLGSKQGGRAPAIRPLPPSSLPTRESWLLGRACCPREPKSNGAMSTQLPTPELGSGPPSSATHPATPPGEEGREMSSEALA